MVLYEFGAINAITTDDCVTLATNGLSTVDAANGLCAVTRQSTNSSLAAGIAIAQDSAPVVEFTPRFLATPVRGCRYAAVCLTTNEEFVITEMLDYTIVRVDTYSFIYGNMNFTLSNNGYVPVYSSAKVVNYAIWGA